MPLGTRLRSWIPTRERLAANRWLRWLSPWLGHPKLWHWSRRGVALGVALGVFFGLLIPIAQIPVTAAAAIVLRANLPAAAASTLITNPVTFGPVYFAAYQLGSWLTGEPIPADAMADAEAETTAAADGATQHDHSLWQRIVVLGAPLILGLLVLAVLAGLLSYMAIDLYWRWQTARRWRRRR